MSLTGTISLLAGTSLPADFALYLLEERSQGRAVGTAFVAIGKIVPASDGSFTYSGAVCDQLILTSGTGFAVSGRREDEIWDRPIEVKLDRDDLAVPVSRRATSGFDLELSILEERAAEAGSIESLGC